MLGAPLLCCVCKVEACEGATAAVADEEEKEEEEEEEEGDTRAAGGGEGGGELGVCVGAAALALSDVALKMRALALA